MEMSLKDWLILHEGVRHTPYLCTSGKTSIGIGRNLDDNGLTLEEIHYLLDNDIKRCKRELEIYPWYILSPPGVRDALVNMCFNMGIKRLLGFKNMITALLARNYRKAAMEALDSKWAKQVGKRAHDVADVIRKGV